MTSTDTPAEDDATDTAQQPATDDHQQPSNRARSGLGALGRGVRELVIVVVLALIISAAVRAFLGQVFVIPSASMADTVAINDRVVAVKPVGAQRGDIIVKIGQKPVSSPAEAAAAVDAERKAGKDTVLMLVQRGTTPARYTGVKLIPAK